MSNGELIPDVRIRDMIWRLEEMQSSVGGRSGAWQVSTLGEPRWMLEVSTAPLTRSEFQQWTSWLARRQGQRFSFTAARKSRPAPLAGGVASDASLTVDSINVANSTVTLSSTGAYQATAGDPLSYYTAGNGYWFGEITADASASGGEVTVNVRPAPLTPHASTANPRRLSALAEFKLAGPPSIIETYEERRVSFSAQQIIRPV